MLSFSGALVIVHDFDFVNIPVAPLETDSPLIVDSDAMLVCSVASERFQVVSRRSHQVAKLGRAIDLPKFAARDPLDCTKSSARQSMVKPFGLLATERPNHRF